MLGEGYSVDPFPSDKEPLPRCLSISFAESALEEVLKMPFHAIELDQEKPEHDESRGGRPSREDRGYWTRYKGVPMAERWYRILADDHAEPEQWLAAARAILQPASVPVNCERSPMGWDNIPRRAKDKQKVHGDVLRNKTKPSVADLMAKRIGCSQCALLRVAGQKSEIRGTGKENGDTGEAARQVG